MRLTLLPPWLIVELGGNRRSLGWALNRPGFALAERVVWREVRDADLALDLDVAAWLATELDRAGLADCPCLLTSAPLARHATAKASVAGVTARAVATVGLSNAERIGRRVGNKARTGTINLLVVVDAPLADGALVEALALAVEARTTAVLAGGLALASGMATGTGTDCVIVAAPAGAAAHAGKHTAVGEALGRAALDAVAAGVADWLGTRPAKVGPGAEPIAAEPAADQREAR